MWQLPLAYTYTELMGNYVESDPLHTICVLLKDHRAKAKQRLIMVLWWTSKYMGYNLLLLRCHGDRAGTGCEFGSCNGKLGEQLLCSVFNGH